MLLAALRFFFTENIILGFFWNSKIFWRFVLTPPPRSSKALPLPIHLALILVEEFLQTFMSQEHAVAQTKLGEKISLTPFHAHLAS